MLHYQNACVCVFVGVMEDAKPQHTHTYTHSTLIESTKFDGFAAVYQTRKLNLYVRQKLVLKAFLYTYTQTRAHIPDISFAHSKQ